MQENMSSGFPTRSDTNWPVQSQKNARCLNFLDISRRRIVLFVLRKQRHLSAVQLLHLYFHICKNLVF